MLIVIDYNYNGWTIIVTADGSFSAFPVGTSMAHSNALKARASIRNIRNAVDSLNSGGTPQLIRL